jgi:hypothetical protein
MARTYPTAVDDNPLSGIRGAGRTYAAAALTADAATSAEMNKNGFAFGSIANESGGSVTITWYGCHAQGGTALALKDQDNVAATQTIADANIEELHSACAGVPFVIPVVASGTPSLSFHFER